MDTETLRDLCIKNNWFTCGSNSQYNKLFDMNENGCPIDELALVIWICSKESFSREQIKQELVKRDENEAAPEPEIIKDIGTNMSEADYQKLRGDGRWGMGEAEAKILINKEFGFEVSRIKIIYEVETFIKDGYYAKKHQSFKRKPQNCSIDYNYVRFNVYSLQYEMVNGELIPYYD